MTTKPLRVITFNTIPLAYNLVTRWIKATDSKHILAITTPGRKDRRNETYKEIVANAPREVDILVTTRFRTVAAPLIRSLEPDLILCFGFPFLIPTEITSVPKLGAVNLHPAVLPAYRGPNVFRVFYDGWHEYGTTVHFMDDDFDTGNILAQSRSPMPEEIDPDTVMNDWLEKGYLALVEGLEKVIAGDKGIKQDDSKSSYAAPYTEEERWLDWGETRNVLKRKHFALSVFDVAKVRIDGTAYLVSTLEVLSDYEKSGAIGDVLSDDDNLMVIQVGDGAVQITVEPIEE